MYMAKEAYSYGKTDLLLLQPDLFIWQKRPTNVLAYLRYAEVSKETYVYGKRDLCIWQKRPIEHSIPEAGGREDMYMYMYVCVCIQERNIYT